MQAAIDPVQPSPVPVQESSNSAQLPFETTQYTGYQAQPSSSSFHYSNTSESVGQGLTFPPQHKQERFSSLQLPQPPQSLQSSATIDSTQEEYGRLLSNERLAQIFHRGKDPKVALIIGVITILILVVGGGIFSFVRSRGSNGVTTPSTIVALPTAVPLFSDNFTDNSKGWGLASAAGYSSTISNNMLTLADANHKILNMAIPAGNNMSATYSDFEVTTTIALLKADQNDSAGLYIRGDGSIGQGYFIDIFGDSSFDIVKIFADSSKDSFLVSPTNSSFINPVGRQNTLTVIAKGSKLVVLINNKIVSSISDNNGYSSGTIELFVENGQSSNGVQASFNHITVYPAPDHLPG
ncbi:MAG TPA: hypothetical protein VKP04_04665 [Ktedonobacteraceae bacterium]|nr:hypothetical protein [Ktedonobacteraceae bacterium]